MGMIFKKKSFEAMDYNEESVVFNSQTLVFYIETLLLIKVLSK